MKISRKGATAAVIGFIIGSLIGGWWIVPWVNSMGYFWAIGSLLAQLGFGVLFALIAYELIEMLE